MKKLSVCLFSVFPYSVTTRIVTEIFKNIPDDVEIVINHSPAHLILDRTSRGTNAGCQDFLKRLDNLESCRLVVSGHIHEAHGASIILNSRGQDVVFVNAALYKGGLPIIVDLEN